MTKFIFFLISFFTFQISFSQRLLTSWNQQNIENYTKEMYDHAQKLTPTELLEKNKNDTYWSEVFLTLNASANNYSKDTGYLKGLAAQITNRHETKLKGTSRLIIWERIATGDIIFEGKGLVIDNDLFTVAGRANQLLQSLTNKNFGYVSISSTVQELEELRDKWISCLNKNLVEEYESNDYINAKIPEITSLTAINALIISLQDSPFKDQITSNCLRKVYNLDEMPKDKTSSANFCNPDTYTYSYLNLLFGFDKGDGLKDANWWRAFWNTNKDRLFWNSNKSCFEIQK